MALKHRLADASYWVYNRTRHKTAFDAAVQPGTATDLTAVHGHKYALLSCPDWRRSTAAARSSGSRPTTTCRRPPGPPLSEYFASSALTPTGPVALGSTENYSTQRSELLVAQTDANGNVGACTQIHGATLSAMDPALVEIAADLTIRASAATNSTSPAQNTSATATASQC
jgi:hypothetical protein